MMRHHIGVHVEREVEVLDLDRNYFSEDDEYPATAVYASYSSANNSACSTTVLVAPTDSG